MSPLVSLFNDHIRSGLANSHPSLVNASNFIAQSHLLEDHYAMPIFRDQQNRLLAQLASSKIEGINTHLTFEDTRNIRGIIRVLVRTHLNRQGIGHVSRGSHDKTLAKRVLLPFEGEFDFKSMLEPQGFATCWQQVVESNPEQYDEIDKVSINKLSHMRDKDLRNFRAAKALGVHDNWAKLLTGIYTGLHFLNDEYKFNAVRLWCEMGAAANNAQSAQDLVKKCEKGIHQFGKALAGSFLADLGHTEFVKPDTHVISSIAALENKELVSQQNAIEKVYSLSDLYNIPPRQIDKIFYIGCSGKLYLYNIQMDNPREFKHMFLAQLSSFDSFR